MRSTDTNEQDIGLPHGLPDLSQGPEPPRGEMLAQQLLQPGFKKR
jgi:hypothetical protein